MKTSDVLKSIAFCLIIFGVSPATAENQATLKPSCGGFFNLCGYVDATSKESKIPQKYERAFRFSEGLAGVKLDDKFGFIDSSGKMVIAPKFDLVAQFNMGLAEVLVEDHIGVIDRSGKYVVKPNFARAIPFTSDVMLVAKGKWRGSWKRKWLKSRKISHYPDQSVLKGLSSYFFNLEQEPLGLYHVSKGWITEPNFKFRLFDVSDRGLIWAAKITNGKDLFGLLKSDGTWQVKPTYSHVQRLNKGLAVVKGVSKDSVYNQHGRLIASSGAVDQNGKLTIPHKLDSLGSGRRKSSRTRKGMLKAPATPKAILAGDNLEVIIARCPSGLTIRKANGKVKVSHSNIAEPLPFLFENTLPTKIDCDKPISVQHNGLWAFIRQDGEMINNPPSFADQYRFRDGVTPVKLSGFWGIIDDRGKFLVKPEYDYIRPTKNKLFTVKKSGRKFWINARGKEVPKPKPTEAERNEHLDCRNNTKIFAKDGLFGIISSEGDVLIEPKYRAINCFSQGFAWAAIEEKQQWCALNHIGVQNKKMRCMDYVTTVRWSHHGQKSLHSNQYESSVLWNRWYREFGLGLTDTRPTMVSIVSHRSSTAATARPGGLY